MSEGAVVGASTSRAEALSRLTLAFHRSGIDDAGREALLTIGAACGLSRAAMISAPEAPLAEAADRVVSFASRRAAGEPLSRIVGKKEFWGLTLTIAPAVLDPRPETETLVEAALAIFRDRRFEALRILDLGVGSGALLCALLAEFVHAQGLGVDLSGPATKVALGNSEACGLTGRAEIRAGDWTSGLSGLFDLIVSNPPYVRSADITDLPRAVRDFDPRIALDGGSDGLEAYRTIVPASASLLGAEGWLLVEIGAGQAADVLAITAEAGFVGRATYRDLAGLERVVAARSPKAK